MTKPNAGSISITEMDARRIALQWSLDNGIDSTRAVKFAVSVWEKASQHSGLSAADLLTHLRYFEKGRTDTVTAWQDYETSQDERRDVWILETVKHIAIANGAGIAGATALLAGRGDSTLASYALIAFSTGLLAAVADFALNADAHHRRASHSREKIKRVRAATSWEALIDNETASFSRSEFPGARLARGASILGLLGVACAIGGIVFLALSALHSESRESRPVDLLGISVRECSPAGHSLDQPIAQHLFPAAHISRHTIQ